MLPSSDEQKAFETLPQGLKATEAATLLPANELKVLRKQAFGQASRFEVLNSKDVDTLSRVSLPLFKSLFRRALFKLF